MVNSAAIGIFDSGIGGLSVARAISELLPNEQLIYVADSGHAPYGEKNDDYIYRRMQTITQFLLSQQVKAIVVACNTATTSAIDKLRAQYTVPIIGVEPGVKPAVLASKTGVIGVLATPRTLQTPAFCSLAQRFAGEAKVLLQPCPELVKKIEALDLHSEQMRMLIKSYVLPLLEKNVDTLVLGCTHYNFVAKLIAEIAGPEVRLIRTEHAVAMQLQQRLVENDLLISSTNSKTEMFYSSGELPLFQQQLNALWPQLCTAHSF
jgi:glutamate racemase